jgi:hypothetical protein
MSYSKIELAESSEGDGNMIFLLRDLVVSSINA